MVRLILGLLVVLWVMLARYHGMDKARKDRWRGWLITGSGLARKSTTPLIHILRFCFSSQRQDKRLTLEQHTGEKQIQLRPGVVNPAPTLRQPDFIFYGSWGQLNRFSSLTMPTSSICQQVCSWYKTHLLDKFLSFGHQFSFNAFGFCIRMLQYYSHQDVAAIIQLSNLNPCHI